MWHPQYLNVHIYHYIIAMLTLRESVKMGPKSYSLLHLYRLVCGGKKINNMKIAFLCHLILIYVNFYGQFSVANSLTLPAVFSFSYLITENKMNLAQWKLLTPCIWMKTFAKTNQNLSVIQLYFILRCNFLDILCHCRRRSQPCSATDCSHFSYGADGWRFLSLTALTVIKYYSVQGTWILIDLLEWLNHVRCVCPSIQQNTQQNTVCVCWLMELEWNVIERAEWLFYWSHLCCIRVNVFLQARHQFTLFTPIKALYTPTPPQCMHTQAWVKGQTPTPMSPPIPSRT